MRRGAYPEALTHISTTLRWSSRRRGHRGASRTTAMCTLQGQRADDLHETPSTPRGRCFHRDASGCRRSRHFRGLLCNTMSLCPFAIVRYVLSVDAHATSACRCHQDVMGTSIVGADVTLRGEDVHTICDGVVIEPMMICALRVRSAHIANRCGRSHRNHNKPSRSDAALIQRRSSSVISDEDYTAHNVSRTLQR